MHEIHAPEEGLHGRLRRIVAGCFGAFAVLLVIGFIAVAIGMREGQREARSSLDWPTVPGTVTEREVVESSSLRPLDERPTGRTNPSFRPTIRYTYRVGETEFEGTRLTVFQALYPTAGEAEGRLRDYPVGAEVPVHHDPEDPGRSVLEPGPATFDNTYFWAFGGGFLALIVVLAVFLRAMLRVR